MKYTYKVYKKDPILKPLLRTITISSKKYIELLSVDEFSIDDLSFNEVDKIIKNIIAKTEYTYENYIKLQSELKQVKQQLNQANANNCRNECILLTNENKFIMELRIKPRQGLLKMIYFSIPMGKSVLN